MSRLMKIWDKVAILHFGPFGDARAAAIVARRWWKARARDPELAADLIRLSGVLTLPRLGNGAPDVTDAQALAFEAGRRDMALQLLAMMQLTHQEMATLMEDNHVSDIDDDDRA